MRKQLHDVNGRLIKSQSPDDHLESDFEDRVNGGIDVNAAIVEDEDEDEDEDFDDDDYDDDEDDEDDDEE